MKSLSCVRLLVTPWATAHQAPPTVGFSRQEYWSAVEAEHRIVLKQGIYSPLPHNKDYLRVTAGKVFKD